MGVRVGATLSSEKRGEWYFTVIIEVSVSNKYTAGEGDKKKGDRGGRIGLTAATPARLRLEEDFKLLRSAQHCI